MKTFRRALRWLLVLALLVNGVVAVHAATVHELALMQPGEPVMHCHDVGMSAHDQQGQASHQGHQSNCCAGGACYCACTAPALWSRLDLQLPRSPHTHELSVARSLYRSQAPATLLRPPIA